jgi:hypothetical protein
LTETRTELDEQTTQMISLEVEVFQLHHLLWVLRYFISRKRPPAEWEHILRESYETVCRMVTRSKTIADLRWQRRMDKSKRKQDAGGQEPIGGGGDGPAMVHVPVAHNPFSPERLLAFEQELAEIAPADLAYFLRAPQG